MKTFLIPYNLSIYRKVKKSKKKIIQMYWWGEVICNGNVAHGYSNKTTNGKEKEEEEEEEEKSKAVSYSGRVAWSPSPPSSSSSSSSSSSTISPNQFLFEKIK
jgi:hypothetical protein